MKVTNRPDGIKTFTEEFAPHKGVEMFELFINAYKQLDDVDKAQHKLANSQTYIDYCDAQRYGKHIYNVRTNGGRNPITP